MARRVSGSILVMVALCGCGPDDTLRANNDAPSASITSHADGAHVAEGESIELVGVASDRDDPAESLMVSWEVAGVEICAPSAPEADGRSTCTTTLSEGEAPVSMLVRDPADAVGTDTLTLVVDVAGAPVVAIAQPSADEGRLYANVPIEFVASASDEEDAPDQLTAVWSSSLDGDLELSDVVQPNGVVEDVGSLSAGQHTLTLTVTDSDDKVGVDIVSVTVLPDNRAPECEITAPDSGASGEQGQLVTFEAVATDADAPNESLRLVLESDLGGVLTTEAPTSDGSVSYATSSLGPGTHKVRLTVTDDVGEICTDEVLYTVGQPPRVVVVSPDDGSAINEGESVTFVGTVSDGDHAYSDLSIEWSSALDGVLSKEGADSFGNIGFSSGSLSRGSHVISVTAVDPDGLYHVVRRDLLVNGLPGAPAVSISPDPAKTKDDLSVSIDVDSVDPESDPVTYAYQWYRDGVLLGSETASTLSSFGTDKGRIYKVVVTPDDGHGAGASASAEIEVLNTPPTVGVPTLSPARPTTTSDVVCTEGVRADDDGDSITVAVAWTIDGRKSTVTASTLPYTETARGDDIVCSVTPNDGEDDGVAVSSAKVTVVNSAPSIAAVSIGPRDATVSDELVCSWSGWTDADGDKDASSVVWKVGGKSIGTGTKLSSGFSKGDKVVCEVTPDDGTDKGTMVSATVTVRNEAPSISAVVVSPASPDVTDSLVCSYSGYVDADGDADKSTYLWTVGGKTIGTAAKLSKGFVKGDKVNCAVTPFDGSDKGTPVSASVDVLNAAPSITSVAISPVKASVEDDLTCSWKGYSDPDGDADKSLVVWTVGGKSVGTGATLTSGFSKGDTVVCEVTPSDGAAKGSALTARITIDNSAPEVTSLVLKPATVATDDTLTATVTTRDADGDKVTLKYAWYVEGSLISPTGATLDGSKWFDRDEEVYVKVTPNDGATNGDVETSKTVVVKNTAPSVKTVRVSPSSPKVTDTLTCTASGYADDDGDMDRSTYQWIVDGKVVGTSKTLVSAFSKKDKVTCRITPFDGTDKGSPVSSSVTVQNTLPVISSVTLAPLKPYTTSTLVATSKWTDADGDKVTLRHQWYIDGKLATETTGRLGPSDTRKGQKISVKVTPDDGDGKGASVASGSVTVLNSTPSIDKVLIAPASATVADSITCSWSGFKDADSDRDVSTVAWKLRSKVVASTAKIGLSKYKKGDKLVCEVTPHDGSAKGAVKSASLTIDNGTPAMISVSLSPSKVYTDGLITASASATDVDSDKLTYKYTWYVDKTKIAATGPTLDGKTWFSRDQAVYVSVAASDGSATSSSMASSSITVLNTKPSIRGASLSPGKPKVTQAITCGTSGYTDADGDKEVGRFAWYKNKMLVKGGTVTFPGSFVRGDVIECRPSAYDGSAVGNTLSVSVTAVNSRPVLKSVSLSPNPLKTKDVARISFTASDPDGDKITFDKAQWTVDSKIQAETGASLDGALRFDRDQVVSAHVWVEDGFGGSASAGTAKLTVANTAPGAAKPSTSPDPFTYRKDKSLQCLVGTATDDDLDKLTYAIKWFEDGVPVKSGLSTKLITGDTVPVTMLDPGEEWECEVVASDDKLSGPAASTYADIFYKVGWAGTMAPCSAKLQSGKSFTSKAKVWRSGITDSSACKSSVTDKACIAKQKQLDFEFGVGPNGSDPTKSVKGWSFTAGTLDKQSGNDWFLRHTYAASTVGTFDYAWRFSADHGLSWVYADLYEDKNFTLGCRGMGTGSTDGYSATTSGSLVVTKP